MPLLLKRGHQVIALSRSSQKAKQLEALGAKVAVADVFDMDGLTAAIKKAGPEVVIHELTALTGVANSKKLDEELALTNRLRTEVTDILLSAARLVGARRFIAQSFCGWPFAREGGPIKTEQDPLDPNAPDNFRKSLAAISYLESVVSKATDLEALALRYGFFYGPGTSTAKNGATVELIRKRRIPSFRHNSATLTSPRKPFSTIRIFSSLAYFFRVRRLISRTTASASALSAMALTLNCEVVFG